MGHLSALANGNDEEDAVISDLEHRDDREAATESEPTTFGDRYEKKQWGRATYEKRINSQSLEDTQVEYILQKYT